MLGGGREARHGDGLAAFFFALILADELADVEIIHPEILPPRRKAVRLVDDKTHHVARQQNLLDSGRTERFGGDVEQRSIAVRHTAEGLGAAQRVEQTVDCDRVSNATLRQIVHLILHQRLQWRYDNRQPMHRPRLHQRRQLEGQRLAAARGENGEQRTAVDGGANGILLKRLAVVGPESVVAEKIFQGSMLVEGTSAIIATLFAAVMPELQHHVADSRKIVQHPWRRHRAMVSSGDKGQGVGQLARPLIDKTFHVGVLANRASIGGANQAWQRLTTDAPGTHKSQEADELLMSGKQRSVNRLCLRRQPPPSGRLVHQQVARLRTVVDGIVQLLAHQLVVLEQAMIGPLRKEQRRQIERVDQPPSIRLISK